MRIERRTRLDDGVDREQAASRSRAARTSANSRGDGLSPAYMAPPLTRRRLLSVASATALAGLAGCIGNPTDDSWAPAEPLALGTVRQYSAPGCSCCGEYASYLGENVRGDVSETVPDDVEATKREHGVPVALHSCHTVVLEDYVVEGHVPLAAVERLLEERPSIDGIALPGMPRGSPGMPGDVDGELTVYAFRDGQTDGAFAAF